MVQNARGVFVQSVLFIRIWVRSGRLKGRIGFRNKSLIHNIVQYIDCTIRNIYGVVFTYGKILEWNVNKSASRLYVYAPKVE